MSFHVDPGDFDPSAVAAASRFVQAAQALQDRSSWPLKIFTNANLFLWHLDAFARADHPVPLFVDVFERASQLLEEARRQSLGSRFPPVEQDGGDPDALTGPIFGEIYTPISDGEFFGEAQETLRLRLERNGISPEALFGGKTVLDAGCGIGKYSAAMLRFGAEKVIGADIALDAISKARDQAKKHGLDDRLEFRIGSITSIPVPDRSVDVAWANSVLHLVNDPGHGLAELARVLKPGGTAFVYVNGRFGLLELLVRALYAANQGIPRGIFQHTLSLTGMKPGRVAWIVGFTFANYRFYQRADFEQWIAKNGFTITKRLTRGIDTDQMEQVAAGLPYGEIKFGEAKLNYLLRRD